MTNKQIESLVRRAFHEGQDRRKNWIDSTARKSMKRSLGKRYEFTTRVEYQPVGSSKIILPWENGLDEDLRYKPVHVSITKLQDGEARPTEEE